MLRSILRAPAVAAPVRSVASEYVSGSLRRLSSMGRTMPLDCLLRLIVAASEQLHCFPPLDVLHRVAVCTCSTYTCLAQRNCAAYPSTSLLLSWFLQRGRHPQQQRLLSLESTAHLIISSRRTGSQLAVLQISAHSHTSCWAVHDFCTLLRHV